MIIECPSCRTKFAIDASLLLDIEVPRFHCSRCDFFFEMDQKQQPGDAAAQGNAASQDQAPTSTVSRQLDLLGSGKPDSEPALHSEDRTNTAFSTSSQTPGIQAASGGSASAPSDGSLGAFARRVTDRFTQASAGTSVADATVAPAGETAVLAAIEDRSEPAVPTIEASAVEVQGVEATQSFLSSSISSSSTLTSEPHWAADTADLPFGFENELTSRPIYSSQPASGSQTVAGSDADPVDARDDDSHPYALEPRGYEMGSRSAGAGSLSTAPVSGGFDLGALERTAPTERPSFYHDDDEDLPKIAADWPTDSGTVAYQADLSAFKDILGTKKISSQAGVAPEATQAFGNEAYVPTSRTESPEHRWHDIKPDDSQFTPDESRRGPDSLASGKWSLGSFDDAEEETDPVDLYGTPATSTAPFASLLTSRSELLEDAPPLASAGSLGSTAAKANYSFADTLNDRPSVGTLAELRSSMRAASEAGQKSAPQISSESEIQSGEASTLTRPPLPHERSFLTGRLLARSAVGFICSVPLLFTGAIWVGSHNLDNAPRGISKLLQLQTENLPKIAPTGLEVVDLSADSVSLDNGEKVLELRGALLNTTAREFSHIRLDARLFDRDNNLVSREVTPASSGITTATVTSLSPSAILSLQERPALEERAMKPNEKRPIRVVFTTPPADASWYSLKVYSVQPANDVVR